MENIDTTKLWYRHRRVERGMSMFAGDSVMSSQKGDDYMIVNVDDEEDLEFYPVDDIEFSADTEWFFEGAWLSTLQLIDHAFPSVDIGDPMCSQDDDGDLGIWVRVDCGSSALWLRIMTFSALHWTWNDGDYN